MSGVHCDDFSNVDHSIHRWCQLVDGAEEARACTCLLAGIELEFSEVRMVRMEDPGHLPQYLLKMLTFY